MNSPSTLLIAPWLLLFFPTHVDAYLIESVTVAPFNPVMAGSSVSLEVQITTPNTPGFLFQPTTWSVAGNQIEVEVFADSGFFLALDTFAETVSVGQLSAGEYSYTVVLTPSNDVPFGRDMREASGSFVVVPEPDSLLMEVLLMTYAICHWRRRAS